MSCCPPSPAESRAAAADSGSDIQDHQPVRGETAECFMATATNPTGKHDDATDNVLNKIDTSTIMPNADGSVNVTFRMQSFPAGTAGLRTPTTWTMTDLATGAAWAVPGVTFTSNGATATLSGTFSDADSKKTYKVVVAASDGSEIDNRGYNFAASKSSASDSIQFVNPLPGGRVTSRFSLTRKHPVTGVVKPHGGCDFSTPGAATKDVVAAADGEVVFTGFEARGAGNYVKIKHLNASGKHLCTTVYMHLDKIYVTEGQKVPAGQAIGKEGNTGTGTAAHLHFECRLPNNSKIDPEPLIRGTLEVARQTDPSNQPVPGSVETRTSNAVLTPENVDAKQSCANFGPAYPNTETAEPQPPPPPVTSSSDPFELAWQLTMETEVIGWGSTPPTLQSTLDGEIRNKTERRACGFVDHPNDPGGVTKFGIAQRFNKGVSVPEINYEKSRSLGYALFWNGKKPGNIAAAKPRTAIAFFNIGYLCGLGGLDTIIRNANITALNDVQSVDAICNSMRDYLLGKVAASPGKAAFQKGWMARVETVRSFCKSVSL